jgi:hypothetical protein
LQREDELAATFVDKVIVAREQQHNEGWAKYNEMAAKERSGTSGLASTRKGTAAASSAVPGPRIRRVLEAGLSGVVVNSKEEPNSPTSPKNVLAMYSTPATPSRGGILSRQSSKQQRTSSRPLSVHFSTNAFPSAPGSPNNTAITPFSPTPSMLNTPSLNHQSSSASTTMMFPPNTPQQSQLPTTTASLSRKGASTTTTTYGSSGSGTTIQSHIMTSPTYKSDNIMPGLSYLKDLPSGLEDTVERFMKAAALRVFVPKVLTRKTILFLVALFFFFKFIHSSHIYLSLLNFVSFIENTSLSPPPTLI